VQRGKRTRRLTLRHEIQVGATAVWVAREWPRPGVVRGQAYIRNVQRSPAQVVAGAEMQTPGAIWSWPTKASAEVGDDLISPVTVFNSPGKTGMSGACTSSSQILQDSHSRLLTGDGYAQSPRSPSVGSSSAPVVPAQGSFICSSRADAPVGTMILGSLPTQLSTTQDPTWALLGDHELRELAREVPADQLQELGREELIAILSGHQAVDRVKMTWDNALQVASEAAPSPTRGVSTTLASPLGTGSAVYPRTCTDRYFEPDIEAFLLEGHNVRCSTGTRGLLRSGLGKQLEPTTRNSLKPKGKVPQSRTQAAFRDTAMKPHFVLRPVLSEAWS